MIKILLHLRNRPKTFYIFSTFSLRSCFSEMFENLSEVQSRFAMMNSKSGKMSGSAALGPWNMFSIRVLFPVLWIHNYFFPDPVPTSHLISALDPDPALGYLLYIHFKLNFSLFFVSKSSQMYYSRNYF
jgi:hypothetical protein